LIIARIISAGIDDLWRAVGVHQSDGIRAARAAAKQLSRVTHPDKCADPRATEAQKVLSVALSAFKDDRSLRAHEGSRAESRRSDAQAAEQARAFQARARAASREAREQDTGDGDQKRKGGKNKGKKKCGDARHTTAKQRRDEA
jgi:ADP-ribosylglycohydrolase